MKLSLPKDILFDSYIVYMKSIGKSVDFNRDEFLLHLKRERTLYGKDQRIEVWIVENDEVIGYAVIKPTLSIEDIEYGGNLFISVKDRDENLDKVFDKMINFINSFYPLERILLTIKDTDITFLNIVKNLNSKVFSESEVIRDNEVFKVKRINVDL